MSTNYTIPTREIAWITIARLLFERMSNKDQAKLIEQIPGLSENDFDTQINEAILKLVEVEAFQIERLHKKLPDISEEELNVLYRSPIYYGSLVGCLISSEESSTFRYLYKKIRDTIRASDEVPELAEISKEMFEKLLIDILENHSERMSKASIDQIKQVLKLKDFHNFAITILGCEVVATSEILEDDLVFSWREK